MKEDRYLQYIDKPARCGDAYLCPLFQISYLPTLGGAPEQAGGSQLAGAAKLDGLLLNLLGQLPGGRQHQHDGPVTPLQEVLVHSVDDGRQQVAQRLARTSSCNCHQIFSYKYYE